MQQTYHISAQVSANGMVSLPLPDLYNKQVKLVITSQEKPRKSDLLDDYVEKLSTLSVEEAERLKKGNPVLEFMRKWGGILSEKALLEQEPDNNDAPTERLRWEYLKRKYSLGKAYTDEEVDDAQYEFLAEKYR
ncbi:MAG: hypothetical protein LBS63_05190 [Prevotellaceae bacterium]|jgi:hypothetical protein|nr:hypothetical protein [Prevotellaceae bacterium]